MTNTETMRERFDEEKCHHDVVKKYCFNCKLESGHKIKGIEVKMFEGHHYVRMKHVNKMIQDEISRAIAKEREEIVEMIENIKGDSDTVLSDVIIYNTALEDTIVTIKNKPV